MSYPATNTPIPSYAGTALQGDIDHAGWHGITNADVDGIKTTLGTTSGTSVLKNLTAGDLVPTQAIGAEVNTGTATLKYVSPKALADSDYAKTSDIDVTATNAVTLTNKTLTSPKINEDVALTSTATELNALDGQMGAWTTYVTTTANLTKGSGTITASYCQIGKVVHFKVRFILAADSAVGTSPSFTLPVTAVATYANLYICNFLDSSVGWVPGAVDYNTTTLFPQAVGAAAAYLTRTGVTATVPFTWGTTDEIDISGTYEAA